MSRWPRLLAYLDARVAAHEDLGLRLAAVAAAGPEVGLVARQPGASTDTLTALAARCVANATPPAAEVWVTGRVDVALAVGADGVIRRSEDLAIAAMRLAVARSTARRPQLRHIASVHSVVEAEAAARDGAEALIVGTIWPSASHPGGPTGGLALLEGAVRTGLPCYAIGGITPDRALEARAHGAHGVAAIGAVWDQPDSYQAALALLGPEVRSEK